jgi:ubiquinone/menaquinone biosynthesis C-methylase UbiE
MFTNNINHDTRQAWIKKTLASLPAKARLLDAGAGELANRKHCAHLDYVSQDFCQYKGLDEGAVKAGLQGPTWNTSKIDLVSDITAIPAPDASFDAILCSEVLEHVPEPTLALDEFARLLKPGGKLIITAPFASLVHMAPYHFCSGFSRYWYEHHLPPRGFHIVELTPNGDWFAYTEQELRRLGGLERQRGNWTWPLAYALSISAVAYFKIRAKIRAEDLACFDWQCVALKKQ